MSVSDIVALIFAAAFVALVVLLAVPILKLGKLIDEARRGMGDLANGATPLVSEVTHTVQLTNQQIKKVDVVSNNVSDATANVSALSSLVASTVGTPLIKVSAFSYGVRQALKNKGAAKTSTRRTQ